MHDYLSTRDKVRTGSVHSRCIFWNDPLLRKHPMLLSNGSRSLLERARMILEADLSVQDARFSRATMLLWREKEKERDHRLRSGNIRLPIFSIASDISRVSFSPLDFTALDARAINPTNEKEESTRRSRVVQEKKGRVEERDRDFYGVFFVVRRAIRFAETPSPKLLQCVCVCVREGKLPSYLRREAPWETSANHAREPNSWRDNVTVELLRRQRRPASCCCSLLSCLLLIISSISTIFRCVRSNSRISRATSRFDTRVNVRERARARVSHFLHAPLNNGARVI